MKKPRSSAFSGSTTREVSTTGVVLSTSAAEAVLAQRVRDCYVSARSFWESLLAGRPTAYRPPPVYDGRPALTVDGYTEATVDKERPNQWHKLAVMLLAEGIHPETYIDLQFALLSPNDKRVPEPAQLLAPKYRERWHASKHKLVEKVRVAFKTQRDVSARSVAYERSAGVDTKVAWARVLMDHGADLSPLFRYCVARHIDEPPFTRIAAYYEQEAVLQFERDRAAYLRIWGSFLPAEFAELAQQLFASALESSEVS